MPSAPKPESLNGLPLAFSSAASGRPSFIPFGALHCDLPLIAITDGSLRAASLAHSTSSRRLGSFGNRIEPGILLPSGPSTSPNMMLREVVFDGELEMRGVFGEHAAAGDRVGRGGGGLVGPGRGPGLQRLSPWGRRRAAGAARAWRASQRVRRARAAAAASRARASDPGPAEARRGRGGAGGGGNCASAAPGSAATMAAASAVHTREHSSHSPRLESGGVPPVRQHIHLPADDPADRSRRSIVQCGRPLCGAAAAGSASAWPSAVGDAFVDEGRSAASMPRRVFCCSRSSSSNRRGPG